MENLEEFMIEDDSSLELTDLTSKDEYQSFGIQNPNHNLMLDLPELQENTKAYISIKFRSMEDDKYNDLINSLNEKQRQYLSHALSQITSKSPFYEFVSGKFVIVYFLFC